MPVTITKLPGGGVRVSTPGGVKATRTTMAKAKKQARLLNAREQDPEFRMSHRLQHGQIISGR